MCELGGQIGGRFKRTEGGGGGWMYLYTIRFLSANIRIYMVQVVSFLIRIRALLKPYT